MSIFDKYLVNKFLHTENSGDSLPAATYLEDFKTNLGDFTTSGDAVWTRVTNEGNRDLFSARSGNISHKEISVLQLVKTTTQASTLLQYDYKTSTEEGFDFLMVMVDNTIVKRYSGTNDWTTDRIWLHGVGSKTIKFIYWKDNSSDGGTDQVWIDNVGLYNYEESAISNTSTLFREDLTVDGDFAVTNGETNLGETNITGKTNIYNTNGYRVGRVNNKLGGGSITFWNENGVLCTDLEASNTFSNFRLFNPTTGAEDVGIEAGSGTFPGGFLQLPTSTVKVRIGEHAGNDPTKMLVVNGDSLFRKSLEVNTTGVNTPVIVNKSEDVTLNTDNTYGMAVSQGGTTNKLVFGYSNLYGAGIIDAVKSFSGWKNLLLTPNGGNVGIGGVTNPTEKLEVAGNIKFRATLLRNDDAGRTIISQEAANGSIREIMIRPNGTSSSTGQLVVSPTAVTTTTKITAPGLKIGDWEIIPNGTSLEFRLSGVAKGRLTSSGVVEATNHKNGLT